MDLWHLEGAAQPLQVVEHQLGRAATQLQYLLAGLLQQVESVLPGGQQ